MHTHYEVNMQLFVNENVNTWNQPDVSEKKKKQKNKNRT